MAEKESKTNQQEKLLSMYNNSDFKRLEPYLEYAFDKAHIVYPANAETLYNYSIDDEYVLVEELTLSRYYLKGLIHKCNPLFDFSKNEDKIKDISYDWKPSGDWINKTISEIVLTPDTLIQLIDFVQEKGSQTKLF